MPRKNKSPATNRIRGSTCRQAVAYLRHAVSSRRKRSLRRQRNELRRWAKRNGIEITGEFSELGEAKRHA